MNKELIKKYKEEFDYWLNGGSLEYKVFNYGWAVSNNVTFNWELPENIEHIVIRDEYVEFRKALAEGKKIEFLDNVDNSWTPFDDRVGFGNHIREYRIKPEEPKFKKGDWVIIYS